MTAPAYQSDLPRTQKGEQDTELGMEKNWEEKQRSEPVFSQDAWLSLFSRALKGEAQNGDQHVRGAGEMRNLCPFLSILL